MAPGQDSAAMTVDTAVETLLTIQEELKNLESNASKNALLQGEKDKAQDELLAMQFDLLKREFTSYTTWKDLEDQKHFVESKLKANAMKLEAFQQGTENRFQRVDSEMQDMHDEVKVEVRSQIAALRELLTAEAKKVSDQLQIVSESVLKQIMMVDEKLAENSEGDAKLQEWVKARMREADLRSQAAGCAGAAGEVLASVEAAQCAMEERLQVLEASLNKTESNVQRARSDSEQAGEKVDKAFKRISTLEERMEKVGESQSPMDWLEEKVAALARREPSPLEERAAALAAKQANERFETLDTRLEAESLRLQGVLDDLAKRMDSVEEGGGFDGAGFDGSSGVLGEASIGDAPGSAGGSVRGSRGPHGKVDVFEELGRLRRVVECIEETMPLNVRQHIDFFKTGVKVNKPQVPKTPRTDAALAAAVKAKAAVQQQLDMEAQLLWLKEDAEDRGGQMNRCSEELKRDRANTSRLMRGFEKDQIGLKEKVDQLWRQMPQLTSILSPLEVKPSGSEDAASSVAEGGGKVHACTSLEGFKPLSGLIEAALQRSTDKLRAELKGGVDHIRVELISKASTEELDSLRRSVDGFSRSLLASRSTMAIDSPDATMYLSTSTLSSRAQTAENVESGGRLGWKDWTAPKSTHSMRCKTPTCPAAVKEALNATSSGTRPQTLSASTGRLPALKQSGSQGRL